MYCAGEVLTTRERATREQLGSLMTSVGMHKDTGLDIVELDPSDGITLIESGRLPCMVNLNQAFQLAELAKFQKQSENRTAIWFAPRGAIAASRVASCCSGEPRPFAASLSNHPLPLVTSNIHRTQDH